MQRAYSNGFDFGTRGFRALFLVVTGVVLGIASAGVGQQLWAQSSLQSSATQQRDRQSQAITERYNAARSKFEQSMKDLATECEQKTYYAVSDQILLRAKSPRELAYDVDELPEKLLPTTFTTLPEDERMWRGKLLQIETQYADSLIQIGREALKLGMPTLTFSMMREATFYAPNNVTSRRMLGYTLQKGKWTTAFLMRMEAERMVDHPIYGWIPAGQVPRFEKGERLCQGVWMSAAKEQAIRRDFRHAWEIGTEHFVVRTNHSLERGVELARKLEAFHHFFIREYADFFNTKDQMQRILDSKGRASWTANDRYQVNFYRTKSEFVAALVQRQPRIASANGIYIPIDKTAYFYCEDDSNAEEVSDAELEGTMYHEVTHQLLGESRKGFAIHEVGEASDFWVVEGFACYLERFEVKDGRGSVAGPVHIRMYWARKKILEEGIYYTIRDLAMTGRENYPLESNCYNQSAAMASFFLEYEGGLYRDRFMRYLSDVYTPRQRKSSLDQIMGVPYELLDSQFQEYMQSVPSDPPPGINIIPF